MDAGYIAQEDGSLVPFSEMMREECLKMYEPGQMIKADICALHGKKARTFQQNKALHLWYRQVAGWLVGAGLSVEGVLTHYRKIEIDWSETLVKELIWRPIQEAIHDKKSTAQLTTTEIQEVHQMVDRFFVERMQITPPAWPDQYNMSLEHDEQNA